jgi:hypothetical protein
MRSGRRPSHFAVVSRIMTLALSIPISADGSDEVFPDAMQN